MQENTNIKCPNCGQEINVNEILYHKLENELKIKNQIEKKKLETEIEEKKKEYQQAFDALKKQQEILQEQREKFDENLQKQTKEILKTEKEKLKRELKLELEKEQSDSMKILQEEIQEKSEQVKELNATKIMLEKLKRQNAELEVSIKAKAEAKFNEDLKIEKEKIQKEVDEKNALKIKEKEEQLKQLKEQLQIAQRKAEQGSQQLQGEVQELAIEEFLQNKFPFDEIKEVKKGVKGADCLQVVHTREVQNCGKIYYESKRTKDFQKQWIEKLKADMRDVGADIGVLVTEVLPVGVEKASFVDGVWICNFEEFKIVCILLRESMIKINQVQKSQINKSDKMEILYSYLTSNDFSMQMEVIVEGFTNLKDELEKEKRSFSRIWKQREKEIDKVLESTINMYSSIRSISGNSIGVIKSLELPYSE